MYSNVMDSKDLSILLVKFTPLVKATAYRYMGRGAEFEDLVQEGYLALIILIRKCADMNWLAAYLGERLPGYVRAAANRIRGGRAKSVFVDLEDVVETLQDTDTVDRLGEYELNDMIAGILTQDELDLTQALIEGFTQKELAVELRITQQAVSARLKVIKSKLDSFMSSTSGVLK